MNPPQSKRLKSPLPRKTGMANNPTPVRQTSVPPGSKLKEFKAATASPSRSYVRKSISALPTSAANSESVSLRKHQAAGTKRHRREENQPAKIVEPKASSAPVSLADYRLNNSNPRRQRTHRPPSRVAGLGLAMVRLLIAGVGLGAIAGTVLANINFIKPLVANENLSVEQSSEETPVEPPEVTPSDSFSNGEIAALKKKLEALATAQTTLKPEAFFVDLDNGAYVNLGGDNPIAAASTIKIPILVAFFEAVDEQKIHLDEMLTMKQELIAKGSGDMQYQDPGKQYTALETVTKMITISDNTATNMLIERLGGAEALNQRFREWGLTETAIRAVLPDLEGTNTTSAKDLAYLLTLIDRGELVSLRSRDRLLGIMRGTVTNTLLPQGIEENAIIAHKTGDIGTVIGDAGIIDMPSGKRYVAAVMVERPHNDPQGRTLIQEISKTAYQHFKWYEPRPFTQKAIVSGE